MDQWIRSGQTVISVLGPFQLWVNGALVNLAMREMRLLALLTLRGTSPRDFIGGSLWPETTQERAAASLRVTVHNTRRVVPDLLEGTRHSIGLAEHVRSDLERLQDCIATATSRPEAGDLHRCLAVLSRGELLAGWRDDWALHERERMRHRRVRALTAIAQRRLQSGDPQTALAAARAADQLEPLRERAHVLAVQAMMRMGMNDEALAHHRRFVNRLHQELGVRPSEQFLKLVTAG